MARQKETPKPLFAVKPAFYSSLDNLCQEAVNLLSAVDFVLTAGDEPAQRSLGRKMLEGSAANFRKALSADSDE